MSRWLSKRDRNVLDGRVVELVAALTPHLREVRHPDWHTVLGVGGSSITFLWNNYVTARFGYEYEINFERTRNEELNMLPELIRHAPLTVRVVPGFKHEERSSLRVEEGGDYAQIGDYLRELVG